MASITVQLTDEQLKDEVWRPFPDFEGFYEISSYGRVRRCAPHKNNPNKQGWQGRLKKQTPATGNYLCTSLSKNGVVQTKSISKAVLIAFHGPKPFTELEVCHIDGNNQHNWASNLKWGTHRENCEHRRLHGQNVNGERQGGSRLKNAQVLKIRELRDEGWTLKELGDWYGVHEVTIWHIVHRKTWSHI